MHTFALLDIGTPELVVILAIVLVLFGSKKLPELARGVGEAVHESKNAFKSAQEVKSVVAEQVEQTKKEFSTSSENRSV